MDDGIDVAARLQRMLERLATETPRHFAAARRQLGSRPVTVRVGSHPPARVDLENGPPWVDRTDAFAAVQASVAQADLDALLDGRLTLPEAVEQDRVRLQGTVDDVLAALEGLICFLHGALRAPTFSEFEPGRDSPRPDSR